MLLIDDRVNMSITVGKQKYTINSSGPVLIVTCLVVTAVLVVARKDSSNAAEDKVPLWTSGSENIDPPAANSGSGVKPRVKVISSYFTKLARQRRAVSGPQHRNAPAALVEDLTPAELFIAVKTTGKYHSRRVDLLLDTWISRHMKQTYVFTDEEDEKLKRRMAGGHLIITNCSAAHNHQSLSCKMSQEYDTFISSGKKWFCHVDDDNYVNVGALVKLLSQFSHMQDIYIGRPSLERPIEATERLGTAHMRQVRFWFATGGAGFCVSRSLALKMRPWASDGAFMETAERIHLPDDCTIGYIIEALLGVALVRSPLFHSHLENLGLVSNIQNQVTLSYGTMENSRNTVNLQGPFSLEEDPTRFRSVHCVLYPDTPWCLRPWRL